MSRCRYPKPGRKAAFLGALLAASTWLGAQDIQPRRQRYPEYLDPYVAGNGERDIRNRTGRAQGDVLSAQTCRERLGVYFHELATTQVYGESLAGLIRDCRRLNVPASPNAGATHDFAGIFFPRLQAFIRDQARNDLENAKLVSLLLESVVSLEDLDRFRDGEDGDPFGAFPLRDPAASGDPRVGAYVASTLVPQLRTVNDALDRMGPEAARESGAPARLARLLDWILKTRIPRLYDAQKELFRSARLCADLNGKDGEASFGILNAYLANDTLAGPVIVECFIEGLLADIGSDDEAVWRRGILTLDGCQAFLASNPLFAKRKNSLHALLASRLDTRFKPMAKRITLYLAAHALPLVEGHYRSTRIPAQKAFSLYVLAKRRKDYEAVLTSTFIGAGRAMKARKAVFEGKARAFRVAPTAARRKDAADYLAKVYKPAMDDYLLYGQYLDSVIGDRRFREVLRANHLFLN